MRESAGIALAICMLFVALAFSADTDQNNQPNVECKK